MTQPMPKIPLFKVRMAPGAEAAVADVLRSGHIAQGLVCDEFEAALGEALGLAPNQLLLVNSGTSALTLAYHLADIQPGDEVVVSPMTCSATLTPLVHREATIVWADVDRHTGLIDPQSVADKLTDRTRAVVGIDWGGAPAPYTALREVVPREIPIIEDAAHAMLAYRDGGRHIGSFAQEQNLFCAWSMQAIKHLTCGDGGALVCPTDELTERGRRLRWFGFDRTSSKDFRCAQDLGEAGYKFHMNDIAAAIGLANLRGLEKSVSRHERNSFLYAMQLADLERVTLPPVNPESSWWLYTILVDDRESFQAYMAERGIETSQVHRRNDEHTAFKGSAARASLPGLDHFAAHQVSIPVGWWLSADDLERIVQAVRGWAKS